MVGGVNRNGETTTALDTQPTHTSTHIPLPRLEHQRHDLAAEDGRRGAVPPGLAALGELVLVADDLLFQVGLFVM